MFDVATEPLFPSASRRKTRRRGRGEKNTQASESFADPFPHHSLFALKRFSPSVPHLASVERGTQQSALCSAPGQNLPSCTENKSAPHSLHKKKLWVTLLHYWLPAFFLFFFFPDGHFAFARRPFRQLCFVFVGVRGNLTPQRRSSVSFLLAPHGARSPRLSSSGGSSSKSKRVY